MLKDEIKKKNYQLKKRPKKQSDSTQVNFPNSQHEL
jgi:hypothetical protein